VTDDLHAGLTTLATHNGVTLRSEGAGTPVFLFPGMEGSGESCLHLARPVVAAKRMRLVLVDFREEMHSGFDELLDTVAGLVQGAAGTAECLIWAQSFGNLLAVELARDAKIRARQCVFVSPFTRLPQWKVRIGSSSLAITPQAVYRATIGGIGRYVFGPAGDQKRHVFFEALRDAPVSTVRRRTTWLLNRDAGPVFSAIECPARAWLGSRDRLVDLTDQRGFFRKLAESRSNWKLSMVKESGHVALPANVAAEVRRQVADWIEE
jgi:pimeloyl-ACP methyl ester carboxylesterase